MQPELNNTPEGSGSGEKRLNPGPIEKEALALESIDTDPVRGFSSASFTTANQMAALEHMQEEVQAVAEKYGLDFFPQVFEVVDYKQLYTIAARGGFPVRYPHWSFGMEYEKYAKQYEYGLMKISEMVINTDICFAYLMDSNSTATQRFVMAHVYGHNDFFKNNAFFRETNRNMHDVMGTHANAIRRYEKIHGKDTVEKFLDMCLTIDDLIDPHSVAVKRRDPKPSLNDRDKKDDPEDLKPWKIPASDYMDEFLNPTEALKKEAEQLKEEKEAKEELFPSEPERDLLLFLLENAPLKDWQSDILSIIRDEAYYFAPQMMTKIMNEGWATYWHHEMMTKDLLLEHPGELSEFAIQHARVVATHGTQLNPYRLGYELFLDIEERWNKGQHGMEYDMCDDPAVKKKWDTKAGLGREKIFEVRKSHNDVTFINEFLTPEFCRKHKYFNFEQERYTGEYVIKTREFKKIKEQLLGSLINAGRPVINVVDGDFCNTGSLCLKHEHQGQDLKPDYMKKVMENLYKMWGKTIYLITKMKEQQEEDRDPYAYLYRDPVEREPVFYPVLHSYDGVEHLAEDWSDDYE